MPSPYMLLVMWICFQAAMGSAFADQDQFARGVLGAWIGLITGLPFYLATILRRHRQ
jgi:hypothetical protein